MPAKTTITTKTEVKLLLGVSDTTNDALFDKLCLWLTEYIQTVCNKKFIETTITDELYNTSDFKFSFWLNNAPVASITSFKKKENGEWKDLVAGEDYEFNPSNGFIRMYEIDNGIADLKISYKTLENVPADLEMVATQLVISAFNRRSNQGVVNESLGEASIQWGALASDDQKKTLDRHARASSFIA